MRVFCASRSNFSAIVSLLIIKRFSVFVKLSGLAGLNLLRLIKVQVEGPVRLLNIVQHILVDAYLNTICTPSIVSWNTVHEIIGMIIIIGKPRFIFSLLVLILVEMTIQLLSVCTTVCWLFVLKFKFVNLRKLFVLLHIDVRNLKRLLSVASWIIGLLILFVFFAILRSVTWKMQSALSQSNFLTLCVSTIAWFLVFLLFTYTFWALCKFDCWWLPFMLMGLNSRFWINVWSSWWTFIL